MATKYVITPGQRFGRWTAIEAVANSIQRKWTCVCDCGTRKEVLVSNLGSGKSRSCGCSWYETKNTTHGLSRMPEYKVWLTMRARCSNKRNSSFQHYGARGIKVCDRWSETFENFLADMGPRPSSTHSIERLNNDGDYCPENCVWATRAQQVRNKRGVMLFEYGGGMLTMPELERITGIDRRLIWSRIHVLGWSVNDAISKPVRPIKKVA